MQFYLDTLGTRTEQGFQKLEHEQDTYTETETKRDRQTGATEAVPRRIREW